MQHLLCLLLCIRVQITQPIIVKHEEINQESTLPAVQSRVSPKTNESRTSENNKRVGNDNTRVNAIIGSGTIQTQICQVFKENCQEATKVFSCESGLRANATSPSGDFGIGQINLQAHWNQIPGQTREDKVANLLDVNYNLALAHSLYLRQGWVPWESSRHCWGI